MVVLPRYIEKVIVLLHGADARRASARAYVLLGGPPSVRMGSKDLSNPPSELQSEGLLSEETTVLVRFTKEEKSDRKEVIEALPAFLKLIHAEDVCVFITPNKLAKTHALVSALTKAGGRVESFEPLSGEALGAHITALAKAEGAVLSTTSVEYLTSALEGNPARVVGDTQLAAALALAGHEEWLPRLVPSEHTIDAFSSGFTDAVATKDLTRALAVTSQLIDQGEELIRLNALLGSKIRALLLVATTASDQEIATALGASSAYSYTLARRQLRPWNLNALKRFYGDILKMDLSLKSAGREYGPSRFISMLARNLR